MMGLLDVFRRFGVADDNAKETRSSTGYTAQLIGARHAYNSGVSGIGELTATVQACVALWEGGLSLADVQGTDMLSRHALAVAARSLALRGEAVFLIGDELIPAVDWELSTRGGRPRAYRLTLPEVGGGVTETALAAEVLHFRIAPDPAQPWTGQAPLRRASLTAGLLQAIEASLSEVYSNAPIGSQVVPFPESQDADLQTLGAEFRGKRGRVLVRESVNVSAAGGPVPAQDWKPQNVTPDIGGMQPDAMLRAARGAICNVFGVLPSLMIDEAQGPQTREAQRHLAQWTLQPMATLMAEEATTKLGTAVELDVLRPVQAYDAGGRARAAATVIEAMAAAKAAGLEPDRVDAAMKLVNWGADDGAA
jgi:phage portal protein BeeE